MSTPQPSPNPKRKHPSPNTLQNLFVEAAKEIFSCKNPVDRWLMGTLTAVVIGGGLWVFRGFLPLPSMPQIMPTAINFSGNPNEKPIKLIYGDSNGNTPVRVNRNVEVNDRYVP